MPPAPAHRPFAAAAGAFVVAVVGCTSASPLMPTDARGDAPGDADSGGEPADASLDRPESAAPGDGACNPCWYGHCIDRTVCQTARALEPGVPLTMQNTGTGAYGDCAAFGSSGGDPQVYYALRIPPQGGQFATLVRIVAAPVDPKEAAYLRVLSDCDALQVEIGARGGASSNGAARVCASNTTSNPRTVIIAVGNYSNAPGGLAFTLSAEVISPDLGCQL